MKYTLQQLRKMKTPFQIEEEISFKEELDGFEDILESKPCHTVETFTRISDTTYEVKISLNIELIVECNVSLERLPLEINTESTELFSSDEMVLENSDVNPIIGQTLDTYDTILTLILCNKPMTTTKDGCEFISDIEDVSDDDSINPALKGLKDLLK